MREINAEIAISILNNNYNYKVIDTIAGKAILMNKNDAFLYSTVTGAGYLDDPIMQFSPKGLMKIFYNAFNYNYVTGIFDKGVLKNTPYYLSKKYEYLFSGDKKILFVEFESEIELQDYLFDLIELIKKNGECPTDYLIQRIEKNKKGNGMEPFLEYLACEYFKKHGYIVENQVPLAHSVGSPDFAGYHSKCMAGFHILELSLIRLKMSATCEEIDLDYNIVGEAKTSTLEMANQLQKYIDTGLFYQAFEIHPDKHSADKPYFGTISINERFEVVVNPPHENIESSSIYNKDEYKAWLLNYFKAYLLSNFTNDELKEILIKEGYPDNSEMNITAFIQKTTIEDLCHKIVEVM